MLNHFSKQASFNNTLSQYEEINAHEKKGGEADGLTAVVYHTIKEARGKIKPKFAQNEA